MKRLTAIIFAALLALLATAYAAASEKTLPATATASAVVRVEERQEKVAIKTQAKAAPTATQGGKPQAAPRP
jgi:sensor domain CHASE-containing protein